MPELIQSQHSDLVQALLAQAMAPPPSRGAPNLGSAFAQAASKALAIYQYKKQVEKEDKYAEEGQQMGQDAIAAFTGGDEVSTETLDPNAQMPEGQQGPPQPTVTTTKTQPDTNKALALALQGAQRGDQVSTMLADVLLKQRLAASMPPEAITPYQQAQLGIDQQNADSRTKSADAAASRSGGSGGGTLEERYANATPEQKKAIRDAHDALGGGKSQVQAYDADGNLIFSMGGSGDPLTGPQAGKQYADFQDQTENALNGLTLVQNMVNEVKKDPAVLGNPGQVAAMANNAIQTVRTTMGMSKDDEKILQDALSNPDQFAEALGPLRKAAVGNSVYMSSMIQLAFSMAKAANGSGQLSNRDVESYMRAIGQSSDPVAFGATIRALSQTGVDRIENAYKANFKGTARDDEAATHVQMVRDKFAETFGAGDKKPTGQIDLGAIRQRMEAATTPEELDALEQELANGSN